MHVQTNILLAMYIPVARLKHCLLSSYIIVKCKRKERLERAEISLDSQRAQEKKKGKRKAMIRCILISNSIMKSVSSFLQQLNRYTLPKVELARP